LNIVFGHWTGPLRHDSAQLNVFLSWLLYSHLKGICYIKERYQDIISSKGSSLNISPTSTHSIHSSWLLWPLSWKSTKAHRYLSEPLHTYHCIVTVLYPPALVGIGSISSSHAPIWHICAVLYVCYWYTLSKFTSWIPCQSWSAPETDTAAWACQSWRWSSVGQSVASSRHKGLHIYADRGMWWYMSRIPTQSWRVTTALCMNKSWKGSERWSMTFVLFHDRVKAARMNECVGGVGRYWGSCFWADEILISFLNVSISLFRCEYRSQERRRH